MSIAAAERILIRVEAQDAISRAGLLAELRTCHDIEISDEGGHLGGVVIVMVDHVDPDAVRAVKEARRLYQASVVLVVTHLDDRGVLAAIEAGAAALLRRSEASVSAVVDAARTASRGEATLPPDVLGRLLDQVGHLQREVLHPRGLTFHPLSDREIEVLKLVAEGHDGAEVGRILCYSERTVKSIIHDITTRLGLRNRTHAVAYALRHGLI